jgi:hypothetical protein
MMVGKKTIETWDIRAYWLTLPESSGLCCTTNMITVNCTIGIIGCYDTVVGIATALSRTQNRKT